MEVGPIATALRTGEACRRADSIAVNWLILVAEKSTVAAMEGRIELASPWKRSGGRLGGAGACSAPPPLRRIMSLVPGGEG